MPSTPRMTSTRGNVQNQEVKMLLETEQINRMSFANIHCKDWFTHSSDTWMNERGISEQCNSRLPTLRFRQCFRRNRDEETEFWDNWTNKSQAPPPAKKIKHQYYTEGSCFLLSLYDSMRDKPAEISALISRGGGSEAHCCLLAGGGSLSRMENWLHILIHQ